MSFPSDARLEDIYGDAKQARQRLRALQAAFEAQFHAVPHAYFTAPGRTEIIGNHTDHNGGQVIAAAIDMDCVAAVRKTEDNTITVVSHGYAQPFVARLDAPESNDKCSGTLALLKGMIAGVKMRGHRIGGFEAYVSSNVIAGAGVSSSAAFEMLMLTIVNCLFNGGTLSPLELATIGQYAENVYWHKGSGLMDQLACAVGGAIKLDFSGNGEVYRQIDFCFEDVGLSVLIINTGKGHAALSAEYSAVPDEMRAAARALGVDALSQTDLPTLLQNADNIADDRAFLRALHFFKENERVGQAEAAMRLKDGAALARCMAASGKSSLLWLQNGYAIDAPHEQKVMRTLALIEQFLDTIAGGCCRIHGGGFAGVVMAVVPMQEKARFIEYITPYVGIENIYPLRLRKSGAVQM